MQDDLTKLGVVLAILVSLVTIAAFVTSAIFDPHTHLVAIVLGISLVLAIGIWLLVRLGMKIRARRQREFALQAQAQLEMILRQAELEDEGKRREKALTEFEQSQKEFKERMRKTVQSHPLGPLDHDGKNGEHD